MSVFRLKRKSASRGRVDFLGFHLALVLQSCATLVAREQVLVLDSPNRGVEVYDDQRTLLGKTPVVSSFRKGSQLTFLTKDKKGKWISSTVDCNYRYIVSGLLNVPFLGQAFDLASGAAWTCPPVVNLRADPSLKTTSCPKVALVIAGVYDFQERENIRAKLIEEKQSDCATYSSSLELEDGFLKFGIDFSEEPNSWSRDRLFRLALAVKFDQIRYLKLLSTSKKSSTPTFKETRYDIAKGNQKQLSFTRNVTISTPVVSQGSQWRSQFRASNLLFLLPNTFTSHIYSQSAQIELTTPPPKGYKQSVEENRRGGLGISFAGLNHREEFSEWDYSLRLNPDLPLVWGQEGAVVKTEAQEQGLPVVPDRNVEFSYLSTGFLYGPQLTLYTPFVSLWTGVRLGPVLTFFQIDGERKTDAGIGGQINIGINQFLGDHYLWFIDINVPILNSRAGEYIFSSVSQTRLGIGYYFGSWARLNTSQATSE